MGKDDSKDRQKHQKDKTEKSKKHSTKKHDKDSKNVSKSRDKSDNKHDDHNSSQKSDITTKADPHKPLLGDVITFGLLSFPVLHSELPTMINALDENRGIMTINIDDKELRSYLDNLMTYLPVKHIEREGWCKDNDQLTSNSDERGHNSASIRSYILNELLKSGAIVQPSDMTSNQSHSSRFTASKLLNIASKYPSLIPDIQPILSSIYDGGAVNIDELDNEEVSEMLGDFLSSLGLKNSNNDDSDSNSSSSEDSEEEEGYQIPSTAITQDIRSRLKYFVDSLDSYNKYLQYHNKQHNANANDQSVQRIEQDNDSIASSDSESGDNAKSVDSTHQSDPMSEEAVRRIGPSLPAFQHSLQQSRYSIHEDEDEDDIDHSVDIGPTLPSETGVHTSSSAPRMDPNIPLGFIGVETYKEEFTESNIDDTISQNISAREEWMLTPGERDPFSGMSYSPYHLHLSL